MKKHLLRSAVSIATLIGLSACGGGGDGGGESGGGSGGTTYTYQAIDGYIQSGYVYVDYNGNMLADDDEFVGTTDAMGRITLPADAISHDVMVQIRAGETVDSDTGVATQDSMLIAERNNQLITPFSTLAKLANLSLDALALELGVDVDTLNSDFVSASVSSEEAMKVRVLARSKMRHLGSTLQESELKAADINAMGKKMFDYLGTVSGDISDLVLEMDGNGDVYHKVLSERYDIAGLKKRWVVDSWPADFTLCYGVPTASKIVISDCSFERFAVVDQRTGAIDAFGALDHGLSYESDWYIDGDYIVVFATGELADLTPPQYFNLALEPVEMPFPTKGFFKGVTYYSYTYYGDVAPIMEALAAGQESVTNVKDGSASPTFYLHSPAGVTYTISSDGKVTQGSTVASATVVNAVTLYHNADSAKPSVPPERITARWVGGNTFIVEANPNVGAARSLASYWYSYHAPSGTIRYIATLRTWPEAFRGMDAHSAVIYYSGGNLGSNEREHSFYQLDTRTGEVVASRLLDESTWNRSLKKVMMTPNGMFSFYNESVQEGDAPPVEYSWLIKLD